MYFKSYHTKNNSEVTAAKELFDKCYTKDVKVFMYFVSTSYDFNIFTKELSNLISNSCTLVGCTSSGEIATNDGITKAGASAIAYGDNSMKVEAITFKEISKVPFFQRKESVLKLNNLGYKEYQNEYKDLIGILLIDGLSGAEEKVLSVINSIFEGNLNLVGGSAGDDLQFKKTLVSINGEVISDGAVFLMIKSNIKMKIYKENIFDSQGIHINITKADEKNRNILEIDNIPAKTRYAQLLNIDKIHLENYILKNPIGRKIGNSIYISSIANINGETLHMYAQVFENTKAEILKAKNPVQVQQETFKKIHNDFTEIYGIFCINCILRSLQFESDGNIKELSSGFKSLGEYGGFVSYGEQFKKQHVNQTLTMLVMGR